MLRYTKAEIENNVHSTLFPDLPSLSRPHCLAPKALPCLALPRLDGEVSVHDVQREVGLLVAAVQQREVDRRDVRHVGSRPCFFPCCCAVAVAMAIAIAIAVAVAAAAAAAAAAATTTTTPTTTTTVAATGRRRGGRAVAQVRVFVREVEGEGVVARR